MKDLIAEIKKTHNAGNLCDVLSNYFSGFPLEYVMNQYKNENSKKSRKRYSKTMKEFALTMYFYSPKAYRYIRNLFHLPHPSQIKKWVSSVNCNPGFLMEVFDFLKKFTTENESIKNCALVIDSMSIRKQIVWNNVSGEYIGYVNYGGIIDVDFQGIATEALVFQIVSLNGHFKCPVAYFLIDKVSAEIQTQLITVCIEKLYDSGINIVCITCDGASYNMNSLKLLGCKLDINDASFTTSFCHPITKEDVYAILDPCHMLKLARNTLGDKGNIESSHGIIRWDYIMKLNLLRDKEGLKFANCLSGAHINYQDKKMNVKLAAQTLSSGVADALDFLRKKNHPDFIDCYATIHFIRVLDRIFDILNSRSPYGKGYKQPLKLSTRKYWEEVLHETANYLQSLSIDNVNIINYPRKVFALGFIITIKSVINITNFLLSKDKVENPQKYFLTYKLSQDHIELLFSCIRARGGSNNNPNAEQFRFALRKLLFKNHIEASVNANCISFNNTPTCSILEFRSVKRSFEEKIEDEETDIEKYASLFESQKLSDMTDNILYYITGYIVRQIEKKIVMFRVQTNAIFIHGII